MLDAWLAIPVGLWIGISGLGLARQSISLLMGTAPPRAWHEEVTALVAKIPGVHSVAQIKARSFGDGIHVWVEIHVDPALSIGEGHDLGEQVEASLRQRTLVCDAVVHVDAATTSSPASNDDEAHPTRSA